MAMEKITENIIAGILMADGVCETLEMTWAITMPAATPMIPPRLVSTAASVRNWARIRRFLAPMAFFKPISRVR